MLPTFLFVNKSYVEFLTCNLIHKTYMQKTAPRRWPTVKVETRQKVKR